MHTLLGNNLSGISEEMLCGSLSFLGTIALFLLCLQDPFPQMSAMDSAGTSAISSMLTSKVEERHWYLEHYLPWGSTTLWSWKSRTPSLH